MLVMCSRSMSRTRSQPLAYGTLENPFQPLNRALLFRIDTLDAPPCKEYRVDTGTEVRGNTSRIAVTMHEAMDVVGKQSAQLNA